MAQYISWSQGRSTSPHISEFILWTFTLVWTAPDTGLNIDLTKYKHYLSF